ncbi:MAG: hypothetical protein KJO91_10915, partial [Gammaproteobacteria bacterium]|nr:hypothetical protein [Gammaproteobacteria bacterium]
MYATDTNWTADSVTTIVDGSAPIMIRMSNVEAEDLYNDLSLRAADRDLYNKDGEFIIGRRVYELTAGQWASIYRTLGEWYESY